MRIVILALMLGIVQFGYSSESPALLDTTQAEGSSDWNAYLIKELKLTTKQANEIKSIREKYRPDLSALRKQKWTLREELHELSHNENKDAEHLKLIKQKHQEMQDAEEAYEDKRFAMLLEARAVLKPEQIANLDDVMRKRWKFHKWRHKSQSRQAQDRPHQE